MKKSDFDRQSYISDYKTFHANDLWPFVETFLAATNNITTDCDYYLAGNGASAAIASHIANDMSKTLHCRARTFHDPALITCLSNDYGFENWLSEAVKLYAKEGDFIILISSSGRSPNILGAAKAAWKKRCKLITLTGPNPNDELLALSNCHLSVASPAYNIIECCHMSALCAAVDSVKMMTVD